MGGGILDGLNDAQREAVTHDTGPLLIVAGAGTGKTTVITRRIAYLIDQGKARPEEILALTFTDKAAAEMEARVDELVPYGYADVEIATFHAFGDALLRGHSLEIGLQNDFRVLSRAEQVIFLRYRLFDLPLARYRPLGDPTRYLQSLITLFSRCKDEDISPDDYLACAARLRSSADDEEKLDRAGAQAELGAAYAKYHELMALNDKIDFGDQIVLALRLLRARPHVLNAYQRRFKYVLVDEFQDTNYAQFELVKLLAARHGNVAVTGDDDQAIYRFRGAAISNDDGDPFLRALNLRGVPWTFSGNAGLYGRPEVRLLLAFLRAVAHPDDSVSVHYLASSDLYQVPIIDLTRCATHADRKHRWLFDVLKDAEQVPELAAELSEEARVAVRHLVSDLVRYMELGREMPTGELLYQFLVDSGWLARMSKAVTARDEAEVQNISKFFRRIQDASKALKYDNVREFVKHLEALIDAGEDPAVAEADVETPAVRVLTVHKAKGLEFPVVFLVHLVQGKFPTQKRRDALELPVELLKDVVPTGDFHAQEERRLFYVGTTRARRELFFTSARDYGGARERKVSQFVLEALDLPRDAAQSFKGKAVEEIERFAPAAVHGDTPLPPIPDDEELTISHKQVDDYQTCPLKYRYVHQLRVPILRHHTLVYGSTIHEVVEFYPKRRVEGNYTPLEDLLGEYDKKWGNQGFLTWEHQEARKVAGREALTRFWNHEESAGEKPAYIEKDFAFSVGATRVRGRFDRVDEDLLGAVIVDYKTSEVTKQKEADRRVAESLQLKMYALAWREGAGRLPQRVELRFIESNTVGRHTPTEEDVQRALRAVETTAAGIRARHFDATPSRNAWRWRAYRQICPFTDTRE